MLSKRSRCSGFPGPSRVCLATLVCDHLKLDKLFVDPLYFGPSPSRRHERPKLAADLSGLGGGFFLMENIFGKVSADKSVRDLTSRI